MLWYGIKTAPNSKLRYIQNTRKTSLKIRVLSFFIPLRKSLNNGFSSVYLPNPWSFTLLSHRQLKHIKILYFLSPHYFFSLPIPALFSTIYFDTQTSVLNLKYWLTHSAFSTYIRMISLLFYSFSRVFFTKLKFKGKGYYIYKNKRNTVTPQFGHSHRIYLYAPFVAINFLSKTSIFVFGVSKRDVLTTGLKLKHLKTINIFTGRGVRFNKQIIYRKVGKVSSYR